MSKEISSLHGPVGPVVVVFPVGPVGSVGPVYSIVEPDGPEVLTVLDGGDTVGPVFSVVADGVVAVIVVDGPMHSQHLELPTWYISVCPSGHDSMVHTFSHFISPFLQTHSVHWPSLISFPGGTRVPLT